MCQAIGTRPDAGTVTGSREALPSGGLQSNGPERDQAGRVGMMLGIVEKILYGPLCPLRAKAYGSLRGEM